MYKPLTKKIIDNKGQQIVVCQYYGTKKCREIHNAPNECNSCPMIAAILSQLNVFEEIYLENTTEEEQNG
jgi:hypothetical protein